MTANKKRQVWDEIGRKEGDGVAGLLKLKLKTKTRGSSSNGIAQGNRRKREGDKEGKEGRRGRMGRKGWEGKRG